MPDVSRIAAGLLIVCLALTAGCSSKRKEPKPMKLERITTEVSLKTQWSTTIGKGQGKLWNNLRPVVDGDMIYVANVTGSVVALERFTGKRQWKTNLKMTLSGAVGVGGGKIVVGSLAGDVVVLDQDSGKQLWRTNIEREV